MTWRWKKHGARLIGNWLISFGTPLGGGIAITNEFADSVLIALIASTIYTMIAAGKMFDEWSQKPC